MKEEYGEAEQYSKQACEAQAKRKLYGEATAQVPLQKRGRVTLECDSVLEPEDAEELSLYHEYQRALWQHRARKQGLVQCMPGKPMNTEATKPLAIEDTKQADSPTKPAEKEIIITALSKEPRVCTEEKPVEYDDLDVYSQAAIKAIQDKVDKAEAKAKEKEGSSERISNGRGT